MKYYELLWNIMKYYELLWHRMNYYSILITHSCGMLRNVIFFFYWCGFEFPVFPNFARVYKCLHNTTTHTDMLIIARMLCVCCMTFYITYGYISDAHISMLTCIWNLVIPQYTTQGWRTRDIYIFFSFVSYVIFFFCSYINKNPFSLFPAGLSRILFFFIIISRVTRYRCYNAYVYLSYFQILHIYNILQQFHSLHYNT